MCTPHPNWANVQFNNGRLMPAVGFGAFTIDDGEQVQRILDAALKTGYRLFDITSKNHISEHHFGTALKELLPKYNLGRDEVFLLSKLSVPEMVSKQSALQAYTKSINNLDVDYLDLLLIQQTDSTNLAAKHKSIKSTAWEGLLELYDGGRVNNIGLSNYNRDDLADFINQNHFAPVINQVELHPRCFDEELRNLARENSVVLQTSLPFGGPDVDLKTEPTVVEIANNISATPEQVLLLWALQKDITVIPKCTSYNEIKENFALDQTLSNEDIKLLDDLQTKPQTMSEKYKLYKRK